MLKRLSLLGLLGILGCNDNQVVDIPPVLTSPHLSLAMAEDGTAMIDASAMDPEGKALTYTASTPSHGALSGDGPIYSYTPVKDYAGNDSLTITISDGRHELDVPVDITIEEVNDAPVASDLPLTTNEDQGVAAILSATDNDSATLTYTVVTGPAHGTLTGQPPALTYTPALHYHGTDTFTYLANDGALDSNTATATITIADVVTCGDGIVDGAEQCDDGNADNTDGCLDNCMLATCGDGVIEAGVEQCDDGNTDDGDQCHNNCTLTAPPVCGDGVLGAGEECDDGNTIDGDGCGHSCLIERCGDGLVQFSRGEQCDDGNTVAGDGCDPTCQVEPFATVPPVMISGGQSCTTAVANAARKIAVDGSGTVYAVMQCSTSSNIVVSTDRGVTYSAPFDLSTSVDPTTIGVAQVTIATGPSGVAYAGIMLSDGSVFLRTTTDRGATWGAGVAIGMAGNPSAGLSLQSFNDDVYVGFSSGSGVAVAHNRTRGVGTWDTTQVDMSIAYFDLLYDNVGGTLAVCADTPDFHIRTSSDFAATFAAEVNPPGSEFYSDWALGNGRIFAVGNDLGPGFGNSGLLFVIPTSDTTTSTSVSGLPLVSTAQARSVSADDAGNAFVASQLDGGGGVQLDRLPAGATVFDAPRAIDPTGGSPVSGPLPGHQGAAVVYTVGTDVWATVQVYGASPN